MSTEIYCRFTINRLSYHTTGWLLLEWSLGSIWLRNLCSGTKFLWRNRAIVYSFAREEWGRPRETSESHFLKNEIRNSDLQGMYKPGEFLLCRFVRCSIRNGQYDVILFSTNKTGTTNVSVHSHSFEVWSLYYISELYNNFQGSK